MIVSFSFFDKKQKNTPERSVFKFKNQKKSSLG